MKEAAYKGMVLPILGYGSSVWDPHTDRLQEELEKVLYVYETGSMPGILGQLKWESLKKRRKDNRLKLLNKGLKGKFKIPTDDLITKTRRGRSRHSLSIQIPSASKDVNKYTGPTRTFFALFYLLSRPNGFIISSPEPKAHM